MKISKSLKLALKSILLDVKMGEIVAKENTLIFDGEEYAVGTRVRLLPLLMVIIL